MSVIAYIRVSTDEQVNGTSLDSQHKACLDYAKSKGWDLPEENIFREEGESAKIMDRPELLRLLDYCRNNKGKITHCIVWKVDRLARNLENHTAIRAILAKSGVTLVSVTEPITDDPLGRAMEGMLAVFAQLDNDVRAARTSAGMKARTEQGGWVHDAPPGYSKAKTLSGITTVEPDEMAANVKKFLELFSRGGYSVAQAVELAYNLGIRTKAGKKKSWQAVRNVLTNPLYAGMIVTKFTNGEIVKGLHKPLITKDTHYAILRVLNEASHSFSRQAEEDWPLRGGFLIHSVCGNPMSGSAPRGSSGPSPRYHCIKCRTKDIKQPTSVMRNIVHTQFTELLDRVRPDEGTAKLYKEIILRRWNDAYKDSRELLNAINTEIETGMARKSKITDMYIDGKLSEMEYATKKDEIEDRLQELRIRLSDASVDVENKEQVVDDAIEFMTNPAEYWNRAHISIKKRIQEVVFPEGLQYNAVEGFGTNLNDIKLGESYLLIEKVASEKATDSAISPNVVAPTRIELVTSGL